MERHWWCSQNARPATREDYSSLRTYLAICPFLSKISRSSSCVPGILAPSILIYRPRLNFYLIRVDPPTALSPSLSLPLKQMMNPLPHVFSISSSLMPQTLSIRLLAPSESPSSDLFKASDFVSDTIGTVGLSEVCATLISDIGRLKRTGMGWEEKAALSTLMKQKR